LTPNRLDTRQTHKHRQKKTKKKWNYDDDHHRKPTETNPRAKNDCSGSTLGLFLFNGICCFSLVYFQHCFTFGFSVVFPLMGVCFIFGGPNQHSFFCCGSAGVQ
jgi:hypothetical protein